MIDQFINFVIRPPRAEYNPAQYLWEKDFTLAGKKYKRLDLELVNERGHALQCSHYVPSPFPDGASLPCVIYCHGNSGCRVDANEAAVVLLPSNITLFTLDFSGSGLSAGEYVSLGWHEKSDLKVVVSHLRRNASISKIGLWGRSMGAVTCLLYGAEDPSVAGMVLDSAFSNLFDLMMELVDVYKIRLPKFTVKVAVQYMRRVIQRKAKFDIMDLNCLQVAPRTFIPALFGHAKDDNFIRSHHSDLIFQSYSGDKKMIKFDGDHNSSRPQFYYDSVSIFFYNVLQPQLPSIQSCKEEKYYELGEWKISADLNETAGLKTADADEAHSSSLQPRISSAKCVGELLSEIHLDPGQLDSTIMEDSAAKMQDFVIPENKSIVPNEECCSFTSSNKESWGRCSSLGSNDEHLLDCPNTIGEDEISLKTFTSPHDRQKIANPPQEDRCKGPSKKSKRQKFEALSLHLRNGFMKRAYGRRRCS